LAWAAHRRRAAMFAWAATRRLCKIGNIRPSCGIRHMASRAACPRLSGLYAGSTNTPFRHMEPRELQDHVGLSTVDVQQFYSHLATTGLPQDPVYSFRKGTQDRYLFDPSDRTFVHLQPTPFVLDATENATLKDTPREFGEMATSILGLPATQRIYRTMAELVRQNMHLPSLPEAAPDEQRILVSFHFFEIHTNPETQGLADVTPEGVHNDGAEHVMVLLLGRENVQANSARSEIFSMEQAAGPSPGEDSPEFLFGAELKAPGEAFFMADRVVKHAVTPVQPADPSKPARRTVVVCWSRRPTAGDRLVPHPNSSHPVFTM